MTTALPDQGLADLCDPGANRIHVLRRLDLQVLEVQVQHVPGRIAGKARRERQAHETAAQLHRLVAEDARIHQPRPFDARAERHVRQQVALQIDAGRDLGQHRAVRAQLHRRAARDDLAQVQCHRLGAAVGHSQFARVDGAVAGGEGLLVLLGRGQHHAGDEDAGNLDLARVERAASGQALHLHDDQAAAVRAAMAMDSVSSVSASRSMVMLPSGPAVEPRTMATSIGMAG